MSRKTTGLMKIALSALHYSGLGTLLAPFARGKGVIFTLHSVCPEPPDPFEPNRILKITPAFLETAIKTVRDAGYDLVSLDEAARRLAMEQPTRPFACFTLDDGYRDNRDHAYPVFKRLDVPMAIYVPTAYPDGEGELWWLVLERAIRKADALDVVLEGVERTFDTSTTAGKCAAFHEIYWSLRARSESELRQGVRDIARAAGYDDTALCRELIMDWDEIRTLAADPLVTIGAHTVSHYAVAKLPEDEARAEIALSVARIERELGRRCRHFSFPYGDPECAGPRDFALVQELGLATGVTTRKDVVRGNHTAVMTGLPRVSLNGDYQDARYVKVMMSGVPFLLFNAINAALGAVRRIGRRLAAGTAEPRPSTRPGVASI
jgi:peptidoglycan/xylan/chitin deacetylase (PgdA/CDA1 family)